MRRPSRALWAGAATLFGAVTAFADCGQPFADPNEVLDFHLELTEGDWLSLQTSELPSESCDDNYPYFEAGFRCGEEDWLSVGVRRRRDRSETLQKLPLRLDFNRLVMGQRWPAARGELGYRRLSLNSGQPDDAGGEDSNGPGSNTGLQSTLLTEHLAWRLMREELPEASNVGYARVTLHFSDTGESRYQGLYVLLEDVDRTTVRSRFGVDHGALFKTTDPRCRDEAVFDDGAPNDATNAFDAWITLNPNDFAGSWYERTNQSVQLDALLRQEALRELFANTSDTPLGILNNYFALDLYGSRRMYLPWDLDDMFRPQPQIRDVSTPLVASCAPDPDGEGSVGTGTQCAPLPLGVYTRDHVELRSRYLEILCRLTNGVGEEGKVLELYNRLDARIRPILADEVPILWEPEGVDPLDAATLGTYSAEVLRMQDWIPGRISAVRALVEAEGIACPRGCEEGAVANCDYAGCTSQRRCTGNGWGACEAPSTFVAGRLDNDCNGVPDIDEGTSDARDASAPNQDALVGGRTSGEVADSGTEEGPGMGGARDGGGVRDNVLGGSGGASAGTTSIGATNESASAGTLGAPQPLGAGRRSSGCSCHTTRRNSHGVGWLLVAALLVARRSGARDSRLTSRIRATRSPG